MGVFQEFLFSEMITILLLLLVCGCAAMLGGRAGGKKEITIPVNSEVQAAAEVRTLPTSLQP
jgi:hypothetical protein